MIYQGKDGLKWWTGIVEDRNDPLALNRVRVRIYGAHTWDKLLIATPDLPWSEVMMPTTSPSLSGLGQTTHGLVEGSTVMGFWRDGLNMQDSVVMGSFIGIPQEHIRIDETIDDAHVRSYTKISRFHLRDLTYLDKTGPVLDISDIGAVVSGVITHGEQYDLAPTSYTGKGHGLTIRLTTEEFLLDGKPINAVKEATIVNSGDDYAEGDTVTFDNINGEKNSVTFYINEIDDSDYNFPEGFQDPRQQHESNYKGTPDGSNPDHIQRNYGLTLDLDSSPRRLGETKGESYPKESYIGTSDVNVLARNYDDESYPIIDVVEGEPKRDYVGPVYPFNHVHETESGHIIELDDTPDKERIHLYHRSGTRIEIDKDGTYVEKIVKDRYSAILGNDTITVSGDVKITVDGDCTITSQGNSTINALKAVKIIAQAEATITAVKDVVLKAIKKVIIQ